MQKHTDEQNGVMLGNLKVTLCVLYTCLLMIPIIVKKIQSFKIRIN